MQGNMHTHTHTHNRTGTTKGTLRRHRRLRQVGEAMRSLRRKYGLVNIVVISRPFVRIIFPSFSLLGALDEPVEHSVKVRLLLGADAVHTDLAVSDVF